jgi:2-oxoglutarate dehydrogenase E2 component (dihydrolipoamide succinyltransferase)
MSVDIRVPSLGDSVTEATIGKWFKQPGEAVNQDEPIVELETDKVTVEINAPASGTIGEILAQPGATVQVNAVIGSIAPGAGGARAAAPKAAAPAAPAPKVEAAPVQPSPGLPVMPAAAKLAAEKNVDLGKVTGTGLGGRVTKGDVMALLDQQGPSAAAPAPAAPSGPRREAAREERVRMTKLRKVIAARLKQAQNTAAMLTTFNEVDMGALMAARKQYGEAFEKKHGVKLGFMSFFAKASIAALKELPSVNAEIDGDDIVYKNYYHLGVAVSTPSGLMVPVLRDADQMSFAGIEKGIADLGRKARDGKLGMDELQGGTFTITNGGIFGSLNSTPILNPPQSGILGMHKIQDRPMAVNGQVVIRPMMYIALSYDHRIIDGREAVTFLVRVKEHIEDPQRLLFDL